MKELISISKVSAGLGVSSRALRYWEKTGLFTSRRDEQSGWRVYDGEALLRIRITELLRRMDIPLRDIKTVLDGRRIETVRSVLHKQLDKLDRLASDTLAHRQEIKLMLDMLASAPALSLPELEQMLGPVAPRRVDRPLRKENNMNQDNVLTIADAMTFIELDKARAAAYSLVGPEPEEEALTTVTGWVEKAGLAGTMRLYGFNVDPYPTPESPAYGFGFCATVPLDADIPAPLREMWLPGGTYARLELPAGTDIAASWQQLSALMDSGKWEWEFEYARDPALEEHVRRGDGEGYITSLLIPVKKKA